VSDPTPLDATDVSLVRALQVDARRSNKELAADIGLAPSSTHHRLRRLRERGVLRGTHPDLDPEAMGIGLQAIIVLRLQDHSRVAVQALWEAVADRPEVRSAFYVGGDDDILLHVCVRDTAHLRDLVMDELPALGPIGRLRTELVFDHVERPLPVYVDPEPSPRGR